MIEKTFLNPTTNKQWRIEIDGHTQKREHPWGNDF